MEKQYLTAEQIATIGDHLTGRNNTRTINNLFRDQDESHLYPINGRFNATERAIKRVRRFNQLSGNINEGLEYALAIESVISNIVNKEV